MLRNKKHQNILFVIRPFVLSLKNMITMKRSFFYILYLIPCTLLLFSSCDKVEQPYVQGNNGGGDTSTAKVRKVLIEDFTGQQCGNCPVAATTIQTIKGIHGEKVIAVAVHANFYAVPGAAPYTYDFRTNEGNDYDAFFQPQSFPTGMINRKGYPTTTHWQNVGSWADTVAALLAVSPDADIHITNSYNASTRVLDVNVKTEFLKPLSGTYKLVVLLIEDSIVKPQKFYTPPKDSLTYVHRHVLRDGITGSWGDVLNTASVAAGDTIVKTYQYTLPATFPAINGIAPNENQCHVVAYIYDAATYEVLQAEEKKMK